LHVALHLCALISKELPCFVSRDAGDVGDIEDFISCETQKIEGVSLALLNAQRSTS
jgi:hypothetical protein